MLRRIGWLRVMDISNDRTPFLLRVKLSSCRIASLRLRDPQDEGTTIVCKDGNCLSIDTAHD